jgi:hypothetical protein
MTTPEIICCCLVIESSWRGGYKSWVSPKAKVLTFALNIFNDLKMSNGLLHIFIGIWDCIKEVCPESFSDKLPMKPVVIDLSQDFWQAEHEWCETPVHSQIQMVE